MTDFPSPDTERQQQARRYARTRRRLLALEVLLGAAFGLGWLLSGASVALRTALEARTSSPALLLAAYALLTGGLYALLMAPLGVWGGYLLPRRYGQTRQSFGGWLRDRAKGTALGGVLTLLLLQAVYALLRVSPQWWWLWMALVMLGVSLLLSALAPVLVFPLFFRFVPLEDAELVARLKRLFEQAGTRVRGVYRFDMSRMTVAANAAVAGFGGTRRILLGDTLLDNFTHDEIETVLAHELGHHVHGDLGKGVAVSTGLTLGGFYLASIFMQRGSAALGLEGVADVAALPLLALAMGAFGLLTLPLHNGWSRWRERLADRYALTSTGKPEAFASAMTRLADQNLADADPERWVELVLMSHPPIRRRVEMARDFG